MPDKKIPPGLIPELVRLSEAGQDSEQLAEWLGRTHAIWVTSRQIRRIIRARRDELADVAKGVVREQLRLRLLPAVKRIAKVAARAGEMERRARKRAAALRKDVHPQHPSAVGEDLIALKAMDRQMKAANLLLHYAGLNQPDKPGTAKGDSVTDARQALLKRVQDLVEKVGAKEPKIDPSVH